MTASLIAFAKTGRPTTSETAWPAWSASRETLLELGAGANTVRPMHAERLEFMARSAITIPAQPRGLPGQPRD
jgi:carboxylesterase type B